MQMDRGLFTRSPRECVLRHATRGLTSGADLCYTTSNEKSTTHVGERRYARVPLHTRSSDGLRRDAWGTNPNGYLGCPVTRLKWKDDSASRPPSSGWDFSLRHGELRWIHVSRIWNTVWPMISPAAESEPPEID